MGLAEGMSWSTDADYMLRAEAQCNYLLLYVVIRWSQLPDRERRWRHQCGLDRTSNERYGEDPLTPQPVTLICLVFSPNDSRSYRFLWYMEDIKTLGLPITKYFDLRVSTR